MDKKSINKKFVLKILDVTFDQVTITQFFHKNLLVFRCLTNALGVVIKKKTNAFEALVNILLNLLV